MKIFREYKAYVSTGHILWCLIIAPVLMTAFFSWLSIVAEMDFTVYTAAVISAIIVGTDYFGLGAICHKNTAVNTIVRSSFYGKKLIKNVIREDLFTKLILFLAAGTVSQVIAFMMGERNLYVVIVYAFCFTVCCIAITISRHIDVMQIGMLFASVSSALEMALVGMPERFIKNLPTAAGIAVALGLIAIATATAVLCVNYQSRRTGLCYRD